MTGGLQTMFFAEVTDDMRVSNGGGNSDEGELIDVVELNIQEITDMMRRPTINSPAGFLFGMQWFLHNKAAQYF